VDEKMGAGKVIALVGGVLGIIAVILFYILPEIFCFWTLDGPGVSYFIGGFGFEFSVLGGIEQDIEYAEDTFLLLMGILVVAGGGIALIGGLVDNKGITILGGVVMLVGSAILLIALGLELGDFEDIGAALPSGENLFFGSYAGADWGLSVSFFLAIGGGVLGVIGGALIE
jgi:hypothetical protein